MSAPTKSEKVFVKVTYKYRIILEVYTVDCFDRIIEKESLQVKNSPVVSRSRD